MIIKQVRLSQQAKDQLSRLKGKTGIKNWNILCRWALCYSLSEKTLPTDIPIARDSNLEMSWLNYVLLGKVYEMKGENRLAADSYITAFNLRPGEDTLYWIENGVFQTSVNRVVPYLDNFLSSE